MDNRSKEVIEQAIQATETELRSLEPAISNKMNAQVEHCYSKAGTASERFSDCVAEGNKKAEEIMKSIEFRMLYYTKHANTCLGSGKSVQDCVAEASKGLKQIVEDIHRRIEKI